ncbi:Beta-galactosidase, partial [termite gut metagenome]
DMGANFIRLGHYQQSDIILRLCDELGILVWEEIPWCRGGLGGKAYKEQARRMLTNMIEQHRNHPSIILWGLGNENDWAGDFETFDKEAIRSFMKELHELAHQLDNGRLTSIRRCDFCKDIVDVYSPSIWAGWYSRAFRNYREMSDAGIENTARFFHAEWGGDSHARRHAEGSFEEVSNAAKTGDWSESYIVRLFDWHLKEQEK